MLRKLRGALGTAVTWGVAWAVTGFGLVALLSVLGPGVQAGGFWDRAGPFTLLVGASGLVGGGVFSVVLGTVHRRRRLSELSPLRMALWGASAGLLVPLGLLGVGLAAGVPMIPQVVAVTLVGIGALGAATGGGTIKLAQAGERELESSETGGSLGSGG